MERGTLGDPKGFLLLIKAPGQATFLLFFSRSWVTSSDDQSIQYVAAFSLCLNEVACGGMGAARALGQQLCVPLDGSSLLPLLSTLGSFCTVTLVCLQKAVLCSMCSCYFCSLGYISISPAKQTGLVWQEVVSKAALGLILLFCFCIKSVWFIRAVPDLWLQGWNGNRILLMKRIQVNIWTKEKRPRKLEK